MLSVKHVVFLAWCPQPKTVWNCGSLAGESSTFIVFWCIYWLQYKKMRFQLLKPDNPEQPYHTLLKPSCSLWAMVSLSMSPFQLNSGFTSRKTYSGIHFYCNHYIRKIMKIDSEMSEYLTSLLFAVSTKVSAMCSVRACSVGMADKCCWFHRLIIPRYQVMLGLLLFVHVMANETNWETNWEINVAVQALKYLLNENKSLL